MPAHLRCTHWSICFLPCIYLWQISQLQTCLCVVVGPGLVSTSPAFMRSSASHLAGCMAGMLKNGKSGPHCWGREFSTQFAQQFVTAVTAPLRVGCVVWSHNRPSSTILRKARTMFGDILYLCSKFPSLIFKLTLKISGYYAR